MIKGTTDKNRDFVAQIISNRKKSRAALFIIRLVDILYLPPMGMEGFSNSIHFCGTDQKPAFIIILMLSRRFTQKHYF